MGYDEVIAYCAKKHYSSAYAGYWASNPGCEVCGFLAEAPHHCRTRGAGGGDHAGNLLSLCAEHHRQVHDKGPTWFCDKYPWVADKVHKALEAPKRGGKVCS